MVFDLDGTLLDSDEALAAPFVALGVPRAQVTFGHVLADECARLGLSVDDYLRMYDTTIAAPFDGVVDVIDAIVRADIRWAVCSNKLRSYGVAEVARLGWRPDVAMYADDFGGPKQLAPVLDALGLTGSDVMFVGDTAHDRDCASVASARFALAGWNPRAIDVEVGEGVVLRRPADLLGLLGLG